MVPGQVPHKEISDQMKMKSSGSACIIQKLALAVVIILIMTQSCINPRDKVEHGKLIPEEAFVSILTDIYVANGLLSLPEIRNQFSGRDSVLNYIDIVKSYGYKYETMNSTVNYYFVSKPKKLIRIYDGIIAKMSEMQSTIQNEITRIEKEASRKARNYNLYTMPDPERVEEPEISTIIHPPGTYNLSISVTVYPDDIAYNPHLAIWIIDADSVETGKKRWMPGVKYNKDGQPHQITYSGRIETDRPMVMKALLYTFENDITELDKHARIEVVSFNFTIDPL
jgi:hypothetical protein